MRSLIRNSSLCTFHRFFLACNFYDSNLNYGLWFLTFKTCSLRNFISFSSFVFSEWWNKNAEKLCDWGEEPQQIKTSPVTFNIISLLIIMMMVFWIRSQFFPAHRYFPLYVFRGSWGGEDEKQYSELTGLRFCQHLLVAMCRKVFFYDAAFSSLLLRQKRSDFSWRKKIANDESNGIKGFTVSIHFLVESSSKDMNE